MPYFNANTGKCINLPDRFISLICGSNGLSSGNNLIEACVQGIGEVFERYIGNIIYHTDNHFFPTIEEDYYRDTNSYSIITAIKNKGYEVIVKDCTLNGVFPVLGLILLTPSRTKYKISLGSDINFDICLQRCVTEVFQGLDFTTVKTYMNDFDTEYAGFWQLVNKEREFAKFFTTASGRVPRLFFKNERTCRLGTALKPFISKKLNNNEALVALCEIINKNEKELFIREHSFLGFPTIRVYIPGMSEIVDNYQRTTVDIMNLLLDIYDAHINFDLEDKFSGERLYKLLTCLLNYQVLAPDYKLENLLGILTSDKSQNKCTIYHFTAELALFLGHPMEAYQHIKQYYQLLNNPFIARAAEIEKLILEAIASNIKRDDLNDLISIITTVKEREKVHSLIDRYYEIFSGKWTIDKCANCEDCCLKERCCYPDWSQLWNKIIESKNNDINSKYYTNSFYRQLSECFYA